MLAAVGFNPAYQPCLVIVNIGFFAAIDVFDHHAAVVIPDVSGVYLRKCRPMPCTSRSLAGLFPLPKETRPTGQLPLQDHVLVVVVVALGFAGGVGCFDQSMTGVVAVGNQRLCCAPGVGQRVGGVKR